MMHAYESILGWPHKLHGVEVRLMEYINKSFKLTSIRKCEVKCNISIEFDHSKYDTGGINTENMH